MEVPVQESPPIQPEVSTPQNVQGVTSYGAWIDDSVALLTANGWTQAGLDARNIPMFTEPPQELKSKIEEVKLPTRDGDPITVRQLVVARPQWDYRLEEAADIQRRRDLDKAGIKAKA